MELARLRDRSRRSVIGTIRRGNAPLESARRRAGVETHAVSVRQVDGLSCVVWRAEAVLWDLVTVEGWEECELRCSPRSGAPARAGPTGGGRHPRRSCPHQISIWPLKLLAESIFIKRNSSTWRQRRRSVCWLLLRRGARGRCCGRMRSRCSPAASPATCTAHTSSTFPPGSVRMRTEPRSRLSTTQNRSTTSGRRRWGGSSELRRWASRMMAAPTNTSTTGSRQRSSSTLPVVSYQLSSMSR